MWRLQHNPKKPTAVFHGNLTRRSKSDPKSKMISNLTDRNSAKSKYMKPIVTILLSVIAIFSMHGQGTVEGTLTDNSNAETIISAYVFVDGTEFATVTDYDGKYSIDLAEGTYTFRFTYIGYQENIITEVNVRNGETTIVNVEMTSEAVQVDEVIVSAKAIEHTENALLMLQHRSDKIQDGISSQEMSRMASGNAANAMRKVSGASVQEGKYVYIRGLGDRYSLTQLNGLPMPSVDPYRNSAQLDMIPTNLLDNIVTSKTFTPDQPGTFTGGNINITTKSFPERQTLSVKVGFRYNTQNHFKDDFLTYDGSNNDWLGYGSASRARPAVLSDENYLKYADKNAELRARVGDQEAARAIQAGVDAVDMRFDTVVSSSPMDYAFSISYGNSWDVGQKGQLGLIASGSFAQRYTHRPNAVQASWFVFDNSSGELQNSGNYDRTTSSQSPTVNGLIGLGYKFDPLNSIEAKMLYNHNAVKSATFLIGEDGNNIEAPSYKLGRALLWEEKELLNYQVSGKHTIPVLANLEIDWRASIVDATLKEPNLRFFSSQYNSEEDEHGIPLANVNDPFFFWRTLTDEIKSGAIDLKIPIRAFNRGSSVKFGGFFSAKDRNFDELRNVVITPPNAASFRDYNGDVNAFLGSQNSGVVDSVVSENKTKYVVANYLNEATRIENSYYGYENVWATYGMVSISPWSRLKVILGGRVESTDIFVQSKIVDAIEEEEADSSNTGEIQSTAFLPSLNLIYSINEKMNLRGGYNHSLARPNLREIAPFASFDPLIDQFFIGNPNLINTDIKNIDLRWEWFFNPGEMISVSTFYKMFDNPISLQYLNSSNPEFQYTNVKSGEIRGVEFELRKNLAFINDRLRNLRLLTNLSFVDSKTDVISQSGLEPEDRPFEGQAPFIANAGLNYADDDGMWDLTLTYNFVGDRLSVIGREAPDIYDRKVHTLDFIANYHFGPDNRMSVAFAAQNLLNPWITKSQMYDNLEGDSIEYITSKYKRGAQFAVSFEYKL